MPMPFAELLAEIIVYAALVYLGAGAPFAVWFAARGAARLDPAAVGAGYGFGVVIFAGAVAFWPLLVRRLIGGLPPPEEKTAHRRAAESANR